jgi:hypothetical protein
MAIEAKEKAIGNSVYSVRPLPPDLGLRSAAKLLNLIGPGVRALQSQDTEGFAGIASEIMTNEKLADQLEYFTKLFRGYTDVRIPNAEGFIALNQIYDAHFMANYFELLQWLVFCFEVNHASFLSGAGVNLKNVLVLVQRELNSRYRKPVAKPGSSGASSSQDASTKPITG